VTPRRSRTQRTGCRPARQVLASRDAHGVNWIRTEDGGVMRADSEILADLVKAEILADLVKDTNSRTADTPRQLET
jgi:hypothetical protein